MALDIISTELEILEKLTDIIDCEKSVGLMIKNGSTKALCDPTTYTSSGKVYKTVPTVIKPGANAELGFHKSFGFCGAEGVVVYRLAGTRDHLCIFYCVPYVGYNGFWLQWRNGSSVSANDDLCSEMSDKQWEIEGQIKWHDACSIRHKATGFMTQTNKAQMIVQVSNRQD